MKKFRVLPLILIVALGLSLCGPAAFALDDPTVEATYCVLIETNTDTVLYSKGESARAYPASLTKMMTVLLAVEAVENQAALPDGSTCDLTNTVTAREGYDFDMIADGSTASIQVGETMPLEDVLYCAMLSSANEACNILAMYIAGSVDAFVERMNERARELGCIDTHFANTHGLPNDDHYTTAWDLSLIAREAIKHPLFREICGTPTKTLNPTNVSAARVLSNTNSLINANDHYPGDYLYPGCGGIKTGFTAAAGYCLASFAEREGMDNVRLLSIVLQSPAYDDDGDGTLDRYCNFSDTATLFDWGFDNWSYKEILRSTEIITEVPVAMADGTDTVAVRPGSSIVRLLPNDSDLSTYQRVPVIYAQQEGKTLEAPINAGQVLGEISIVKDGRTIGTSSLVASSEVSLSRVRFMRTEISNTLHKPIVKITFWVLFLLFLFYIFVVVRYRRRRREYEAEMRRLRVANQVAEEDKDVREWFHTRQETVTQPAAIRSEAPRKRPVARPKADPRSPSASEDESFCDYFDEFFGSDEDDGNPPRF